MNSKIQETQYEDFKIDENIAYFIGVLHSDGCIYFFNYKKENRRVIRLNLTVGSKSIPMAKKFKNILLNSFGKTVNIRKIPNKDAYCIQTSINKVWHIFQHWGKYNIPQEIKGNIKLFGAYLAGIIDGDGFIQIKNNKDRIIPQCVVKVTSNHPLHEIKILIELFFNCKVYFEPIKGKNAIDTCFYVSRKNIELVKNLIYPNIVILHKIKRLDRFFKMWNEPAGIRNSVLQQ